MAFTRRTVLGSTAAMLSVAGCLGRDSSDTPSQPTPSNTPGTTTSEPTPTDTMASVPVRVRSHPDLGDILVGPDGMTLYMFDSDTQGASSSSCAGECIQNWPPLTVNGEFDAGVDVEAELTTFTRESDTTQVAANGWPLYYFVGDSSPGDIEGHGVGDVWWALRPDGTPIKPTATTAATVQTREHPDYGDILVGPDGLTLYMFDSDTQGAESSSCTDGCAETWPPLLSENPTAGRNVTAELTTFDRDDNSTQVAANGWPLYYFAPDSSPGDTEGQGVNDVWWILDPSGTPIKPDSGTDYSGTNY